MKSFKLVPVFKDYLWGGTKLRDKYGKKTDVFPVAESWELSCHKDGKSIISGGEFDGKTLEEYISENPEALGTCRMSDEMPVLVKLIDAKDRLSIQVHPCDELAKKWENQNGKTEMWYVLEAESDATITCGVARDITRDELKLAISEKTVESLLNTVPSKKGDVFFVEAGTIHAIGKGNLIVEIQQNSNVTYRLYDFGRVDKNGNERELHIEKGVASSNCNKNENRKMPLCPDGTRLLGCCEWFAVREAKINGEMIFDADPSTYNAVITVDGEVELLGEDDSLKIGFGETVFIPANAGKYALKGEGIVLIVSNSARFLA